VRAVLVTGGAGFIGLHLTRRLLSDPDVSRVWLIDDFSRGSNDADLAEVCSDRRVSVVRADLTRRDDIDSLPRYFDEIYHLAAVNGTRLFYDAPDRVLRVNSLSAIHVLDWISEFSRPPRLLVTSSNEAYAGALEAFGDLPIPTPEGVPLVVSDVRNPRWSYGASKILTEMVAVHYARARGIPTVLVRPHNFYGPRSGDDHVVPALVRRALDRTDPFRIYGASETRAFLYIEDGVDAMVRLMSVASPDCPIVHVGTSEETVIGDLAEAIFADVGWRPRDVDRLPSPPGSVRRRAPDVSLARSFVGWSPSTTLAEGIRRTVAWHASRRD